MTVSLFKKSLAPEPSSTAGARGHLILRVCVGLMIFNIHSTACGADTALQSPPPYKQLRYDEDYSYLREPERRHDFFDPIKYIRFDDLADYYLSLGGEVRERYEYFANYNWGKGPQDNNGYLLQRYMVHADLHLGPDVRLFTQLKSGLEDGRNGGARPPDRDDFDLNQAFIDVTGHISTDNSLMLRLGRQELTFGSSRLVSVRESPNVRQSFDGARATLRVGGWNIDSFLTRPVETNPGIFDDSSDRSRLFWGAYAVHPLPMVPGGHIDLYYFGIERDQATYNQGSGREERHSIGTRLWGEAKGLDYNFEAVYQFGSFRTGDINAWTVASDTGYTFKSAPLTPRLGLKADVASGDGNPGDSDLGTFSALFPKGAYFSETDLIGPANIIDLHPSIEVHFSHKIKLSADWDFFWRESTRDGIYGIAVNLLRSGQQSDANYIGSQPQARLDWEMNRHLSVALVYAHFFPGDYLKQTPPGKDVDYGSAWATYKF